MAEEIFNLCFAGGKNGGFKQVLSFYDKDRLNSSLGTAGDLLEH